VRRAISPLEESITENTDEKAKDFDHKYGVRIWQPRTYKHKGVQWYDYFGHRRADREDGFHDGLNINLGSIKMKPKLFRVETILKHIWNTKGK
jgi:hypothetical protein